MHRFILLLITYIIIFSSAWGSNVHYSYTQLSLEEGLSQASVQSILLDSRGDLWIGTKNGLNLYAQQKMTNYFHTLEDRYSIPNNHILHLAEDSLGNIWISTLQGLASYNRKRNAFDTFTRGRVQSSLCIEGGILFGGDNILYFYDYQTQQLEQRTHLQPESAQTIPIQYSVEKKIPIDNQQLLIATRRKGIFLYHTQTG